MVNPNKKIPDKIPCPTDAHWQYEFEKIRERLELVEGEDTWDKIEAALATFNALVRGGAYRFESFVPTIREYSNQLCGAVLSERGRLSSTAVGLCSNIVHGLGNNFRPLVPIIVPALVDLCRRPNKVVLTRAQACVMDVVCMSHCSDILKHLRAAARDKSVQLRKACAEATLKALQKWGIDEIGKRVEDVEDIIRAIGRDPGPDVRKVAKEIYELYSTKWPERLRDFNAPLTPVTRKYLGVTGGAAVVHSDTEAPAPPLLKRSASTRSLAASRPRPVTIACVTDVERSSSAAAAALAFPTRAESPAQMFHPLARVRNGGLVANAGPGVGKMSKRFEAIRSGGRIQNRHGNPQDPAPAPLVSSASRVPSPANAPFDLPTRSASVAALRDAITALDDEAERLHIGGSEEPVEQPPSRPASAMSRPRAIFIRQEEQPAQRPRVISIPTRPNSVLQHYKSQAVAPVRSLPPVESQTQMQAQAQFQRPASRTASNNSSSRPASVASVRPPSRLEQTTGSKQRKRHLVDIPSNPQQRPRVIHLPTSESTSSEAGPAEDPRWEENVQRFAFAPVKGNVSGADIPEKKVPSKRLAAIKRRLLTAEEIDAMQQVNETAKALPSSSASTDSTDVVRKMESFPSTNPAPTVSVPVKVSQEARPTARTRVNSAATVPTQATRDVIKRVATTVGAGTSAGFIPKRGNTKPTTAAPPTQTSKTSNLAGPSGTAAPQLSRSTQTKTITKPEQGPVPPRGRTASNAPRPAWGSGGGARSISAKPGERQRTTSNTAAPAPVIVAKARDVLPRKPHAPTVNRTANGGNKLAVSTTANTTTTTSAGRPMLKKSTSMVSLNVKDKPLAGAQISVAAKATVASAARARQPFRPVRHKEVEKAAAIPLPVTPPPEVIAAAAVALPTSPTIPKLELPPAVVNDTPPPKERATCEIPKGVKVSTQPELSLVAEVSNSAIFSTPGSGSEKTFPGLSKLQEESGGAGKTNRSPLGEIPLNAAS